MRVGQVLVRVALVGFIVALSVFGAVSAFARVGPGPGVVDYGPTITTDRAKLFAVYSLIEQMRLEHNRQGALALADREAYLESGKFRTYQEDQYKPRLKKLLTEQSRLKRAIREATYTAEEWIAVGQLEDWEQGAVAEAMYGDRAAEREKPTVATSDVVTELEAVDLDRLESAPLPDPVEDLSTYTKGGSDPGNWIVVSGDDGERVTVTDMTRYETAFLYYDFGVDHFDGDFAHWYEGRFTDHNCGGSAYARNTIWGVTNVVEDAKALRTNNRDYIELFGFWDCSGSGFYFWLEARESTSVEYDTSVEASVDTTYWHTLERDEGQGSYGETYDFIYDNDTRTSEFDTVTVVLEEKEDFRYCFVANAYHSDTGPGTRISMWHQDYDHQGGAPGAVGHSFGYIIGG